MPAAIRLLPTGTWTINSVQVAGGNVALFTTNTAGVLSGAVTLSTTVAASTVWWMADGWNGLCTVSATISGQTVLRTVTVSANSQSEIELNSGDLDRYILDSSAGGGGGLVAANNLSELTATAATARTNIAAVGTARQVITGGTTGLTGGGDLSADRTLQVAWGATGSTSAVGNDARITGAVQGTRQIITGGSTGLTGGGDLTADRTLQVAWGTTSTTSAVGNDSRIVGADQVVNTYLGQHSLLMANGDPAGTTGTVTLAAGTVYGCRVVCGISGNVTKLFYNMNTAGSGMTAGQCFLGLASAAGTLLQQSDDQTTNMGATGNKTGTITSTAVVAGTVYYILMLANFSTTGPTVARFSNGVFSNLNTSGATLRWSIVATGQTALATFTPSANTTTTTCVAVAAAI